MTVDLSSLSQQQQDIYGLLEQGYNVEKITRKLGLGPGIASAQITRMRTKGIKIPEPNASDKQATRSETPAPAKPFVQPGKPMPTGASSNDAIADELRKSAPALSNEELMALAKRVKGDSVADIHPMVLLGVAMQFMKLCGGRFAAHQVIEDVYGGLRLFTGQSLDPAEHENVPADPVATLSRENEQLRQENQRLTERLRGL